MKDSDIFHLSPFNEVDNPDPNKPDSMGEDLYFGGWDEIMKFHLDESGPLLNTPNSAGSHDVFGGPAPGEPNPAGASGMGGSFVSPKTVDGGTSFPGYRVSGTDKIGTGSGKK